MTFSLGIEVNSSWANRRAPATAVRYSSSTATSRPTRFAANVVWSYIIRIKLECVAVLANINYDDATTTLDEGEQRRERSVRRTPYGGTTLNGYVPKIFVRFSTGPRDKQRFAPRTETCLEASRRGPGLPGGFAFPEAFPQIDGKARGKKSFEIRLFSFFFLLG